MNLPCISMVKSFLVPKQGERNIPGYTRLFVSNKKLNIFTFLVPAMAMVRRHRFPCPGRNTRRGQCVTWVKAKVVCIVIRCDESQNNKLMLIVF